MKFYKFGEHLFWLPARSHRRMASPILARGSDQNRGHSRGLKLHCGEEKECLPSSVCGPCQTKPKHAHVTGTLPAASNHETQTSDINTCIKISPRNMCMFRFCLKK